MLTSSKSEEWKALTILVFGDIFYSFPPESSDSTPHWDPVVRRLAVLPAPSFHTPYSYPLTLQHSHTHRSTGSNRTGNLETQTGTTSLFSSNARDGCLSLVSCQLYLKVHTVSSGSSSTPPRTTEGSSAPIPLKGLVCPHTVHSAAQKYQT